MVAATLIVNIFIAIGTIGAATVALWLGIQAQRSNTRQAREARLKLTRQIICIYQPTQDYWSTIEIINASPEVVTRVVVLVSAVTVGPGPHPDDPGEQPWWTWEDTPSRDLSNVGYLLPGAHAVLRGRFVPRALLEGGDSDGFRRQPSLSVDAVAIEVIWQDSYGDVWNKRRGEEAFPTSWAAPWRDLRNGVPSWRQPSYWPTEPRMHPRPPISARLTQRTQQIKYRLARLPKPRWGRTK